MDAIEAQLRKFELANFIFFIYFGVAIPGFLSLDKIFNQLVSFVKDPKRSDLYTLCWSKLLENHTLYSDTYLYSPYMEVPHRASNLPIFSIRWAGER